MAGIGHHAVQFLRRNPGKRYTARQIALAVLQMAEKDFVRKREALARSHPNIPLENQLVAELSSQRPTLQRRHPELMTDESVRPKLYYWAPGEATEETSEEGQVVDGHAADVVDDLVSRDEKALYEPIRRFLHTELGVLSVRIDERTSSNNRGPRANQWQHPDIAGMLPKGRNWQPEVLQCAQSFGAEVAELWSVEVKLEITTSNLRESFFQAVSNSSWATYGYLLAAAVSGRDTWDELEMLCAAHGIGFIRFDADNPAESLIAIPARKRPQVDWNTVNRIASQNRDFREYAQRVSAYLKSGYLDQKTWGL